MYQVAIVPFLDTGGFLSLLDTKRNEIYIVPKSICEIFDISWQSQYNKLTEYADRWHYQTIMVELPGDDRKRKVGIIPDEKVRSWVCSINPEKVRPDIREQLIAFQTECDRVLHDYWTKGIAVNPRHNYQMEGDIRLVIAETVGMAVTKAMQELAIALRGTFVSTDTFQNFANQCDRRFSALEDERKPPMPEVPASALINVEQSHLIRKLVNEKGRNRKEIFEIWKRFRQKFQVKSYQHLPISKFQEALRWINQL